MPLRRGKVLLTMRLMMNSPRLRKPAEGSMAEAELEVAAEDEEEEEGHEAFPLLSKSLETRLN